MSKEELQQITDHIRATLKAEETKLIKARHDKKRANIRLLLRNYRNIVRHVEYTEYEPHKFAKRDDLLKEILELMDGGDTSKFELNSLLESSVKSRMLLDHIDNMLDVYRWTCETSDKPEDERRERIIYARYIADKPQTIEEIAQAENIDTRTVYRDIDAACEVLTVLFFGVFGLQFL
ncbi:MAG: HTH domain-containing protein [Turicibacter sp.]|nr:HTH domain-containing protein [Turicibacter sp.]